MQAKLTALATLRDLPESERTQAQDLYQQAISHLQGAKNHADTLADYQQLQQSAPLETARLQQTLAGEAPPEPSPTLSTEDLSRQLAQAQASLSDAQKRLANLDQHLTVQQAVSYTHLDVYKRQIKNPENFFMLRGNHECSSINRIYGFYDECTYF